MKILTLNGKWFFSRKSDTKKHPATVPGCIHTDLQENKIIGDLSYRDNEDTYRWIDKETWIYTRDFTVDASFLDEEKCLLRCNGLDTFAEIKVNSSVIAHTNNQHRVWEFDVKKLLKKGKNTITITFSPTWSEIEKQKNKRHLGIVGGGRIEGGNYIRKAQYQYGWDWGPVCVTAGVWRDIELVSFSTARLESAFISQEHHKDFVRLTVAPEVELTDTSANVDVSISVSFEGKQIANYSGTYTQSPIEFTIKNPKLWWPNGMGDQPLYTIAVELRDNSLLLDTWTRRIGLRTLQLSRTATEKGERFEFVANGIPFFAKGANWIPADAFVTRISEKQYSMLLDSARDANMNMIRVWGGGIYEPDVFYDLCDEMGLCVWQDFMFACSAYPIHDSNYIENVKVEFKQNIIRLRHHASLALWCGNNELEQMWADLISEQVEQGKMTEKEYLYLFDTVIPEMLSLYDPERSYWPSSAHSPVGDRKDANNPHSGDAHLWEVWHGREPFEWYRTCEHSFNSEFGFQSFPEPEVVKTYTEPEDRNITSYIMEKHQKSFIGNDAIMQYMMSWYLLPKNFEMTLFLSQILQGMAIKYAVEHWRRRKPHGTGTIYWQLNDCWGVASWSSIDYFGNKKGLQYIAKKFFAPLLVSGLEDMEKGVVDIWITSDMQNDCKGTVTIRALDLNGKVYNTISKPVTVKANSSKVYYYVNMYEQFKEFNHREHLLVYKFETKEGLISENMTYFSRPKHLLLRKPTITISKPVETANGYKVTLKTDTVALWVWLSLDGKTANYSDRFFHLLPDNPVSVFIHPRQKLTIDEIGKKLTVSSLVDTFS